jgi:hypothetical protein
MADQKNEKSQKQGLSAVPLPADVQACVDYVRSFCVGLSPREQHNAFNYQLASRGWSYGVSVDADGKKHPWACHWKQLNADARAQQAITFNQRG